MLNAAIVMLRPGDKALVVMAADQTDQDVQDVAQGLHQEFPGVQFVVVSGVTQVVAYHDGHPPGGTS